MGKCGSLGDEDKLFLRHPSFYGKKVHTAHATNQKQKLRTLQMMEVYAQFAEEFNGLAGVQRKKDSLSERFAGADEYFMYRGYECRLGSQTSKRNFPHF